MRAITISIIVACAASPCLAGDKKTPDLWFGDASYSHTIASSWFGQNEQEHSSASLSTGRDAHIWTHIHFCVGGPERLNHAKGQFGYRDVSVDKREYSQDHKMCKGKKQKGSWIVHPRKVTPGDSEKTTETKSTVAVHDETTTGYNEWGNYHVTWMPGDGALSFGVMMPFVDIVIRTTIERNVEGWDACASKKRPDPKDPEPLKLGHRMSVPIKMDEPRMTYTGTTVLKDLSGEEGAKGHRPNWEHIPSRKITGSYTEREIRTWYFTSDACGYVKNQMNNVETVKDIFEQIAGGKAPPNTMSSMLNKAGGGSIFSPMQTEGSTCRVIPAESDSFRSLEEIRKRYYKCLPDVVFEADIIHEGVHQESCASRENNNCRLNGTGKSGQRLTGECTNPTRYGNRILDPVNRANEEVPAYQAQYAHLESWYNEHCTGE
jgi:hypothetical protein